MDMEQGHYRKSPVSLSKVKGLCNRMSRQKDTPVMEGNNFWFCRGSGGMKEQGYLRGGMIIFLDDGIRTGLNRKITGRAGRSDPDGPDPLVPCRGEDR